ncbi:hypothetical protein A2U01_0036855, partial [Trifolium medium]|nr:hypothetical protein [Trifolium medium]
MRETQTKASHDRVRVSSRDVSPSNTSNPNEMVQPSKTVASKSTKSPITNDQTSSGHKEVTKVTSFEHLVTPSGHSNAAYATSGSIICFSGSFQQAGNSLLVNQEIMSCDDFTAVLSTIDSFLDMTPDSSASVLRLPPTSC